MECCNTPDVIYPICNPTLAVSGLSYFIFSGVGLYLRVLLSLSCSSYHVIMCIAFAYVFVSCIQAFSLLSVLHSGAPISSGAPFYLFSCAGVIHSRNGTRHAKWPWYTTGRPPVKFRAIWRSFDAPTVNRVTAKASFRLQPNTPPKQPNNPYKSLPCSPSSDHNRVGENRTPFGAS